MLMENYCLTFSERDKMSFSGTITFTTCESRGSHGEFNLWCKGVA